MKNLLYGRIGKCIIVIWEMLEKGHIRSWVFFWCKSLRFWTFTINSLDRFIARRFIFRPMVRLFCSHRITIVKNQATRLQIKFWSSSTWNSVVSSVIRYTAVRARDFLCTNSCIMHSRQNCNCKLVC